MAKSTILFSSGLQRDLDKPMLTVGFETSHDVALTGPLDGALFTLMARPGGRVELLAARHKLKVNGSAVPHSTVLHPCDRIEWDGGAAVLIDSAAVATAAPTSHASLALLQKLAALIPSPGGIPAALDLLLSSLVTMADAEAGSMLSEAGHDGGWNLVACAQPGAPTLSGDSSETTDARLRRKDLFSNTILQEAVSQRKTVYVENIIGHPWAEAASVIEARIFSAVCAPLCVGDRVFGAIFLYTRSPGRSIKRETAPELQLLATQAALLLGAQTELRAAKRENAELKRLAGDRLSAGFVMGSSEKMAALDAKISKLAPTPLSVLILGETGTGKERVAQELHRRSDRASKPFVAINCAAIPATLLESTLFGYEKGAFTGATRAQAGKFVQAEGGTLFLDEIGELSPELQSKLLRVLQEKAVEPVGATRPIALNVRIVAATHQNLETAVESGRFRQDLYFRLNGATLRLPNLRERSDDILVLARHFLARSGADLSLTPEAEAALVAHAWPGNVRELEQAISRVAALADGPTVTAADLELGSPTGMSALSPALAGREFNNLDEAQAEFTREYVQRMLTKNGGRRAETAEKLGVSERTLYRLLDKFLG